MGFFSHPPHLLGGELDCRRACGQTAGSTGERLTGWMEYAREFCMCTSLADTMFNSLFWIGDNYYCPVDLPDTNGLSWTEGILRCLESGRPSIQNQQPNRLGLFQLVCLNVK